MILIWCLKNKKKLYVLIKEKSSIIAESYIFIKEKENYHITFITKFNDISPIFIYLIKKVEKFENFGINKHNLAIDANYIDTLI